MVGGKVASMTTGRAMIEWATSLPIWLRPSASEQAKPLSICIYSHLSVPRFPRFILINDSERNNYRDAATFYQYLRASFINGDHTLSSVSLGSASSL